MNKFIDYFRRKNKTYTILIFVSPDITGNAGNIDNKHGEITISHLKLFYKIKDSNFRKQLKNKK
jgi:hypothetical protein